MSDLQQLAPGIIAGMLAELAKQVPTHADLITEAARRIELLPSHGVVKPIRDELMANGSPSEIIAELINANVKLRRLISEC